MPTLTDELRSEQAYGPKTHIGRLCERAADEIEVLKAHIRAITDGGMRNVAIISQKVGPMEPLTITATKGQILAARKAITQQEQGD